MNKVFTLTLMAFSTLAFAQKNLKTTFEQSNGTETGTYEQTIEYYHALAASSDHLTIEEMGITDSGLPLHLVILDLDHDFNLEKSRTKGKTIVLINNGIHPGEPDGIEASKMLLRDFATDSKKQGLIKDVVLAVVPLYNIGGALNRNEHTRANQEGPVEYGFRGNARNYDLNRDFIKADSRNARVFYQIYHKANPDIFIDTHVSNGADYQYPITHLATQHDKMGGSLGDYIEDRFTPDLEAKMKEKGTEITPYVNVFNSTPDKAGFSQFYDGPRYSTGYTTLFHTLGFMIETHMLKPFDLRVEATYNFLVATLELANEQGENIQALRNERESFFKPGNIHPISWKLDRSEDRQIEFKGYEGKMRQSKVTDQQRLFYDRNKPYTKTIPYYNHFVADKEITIPKAYVIPQGWIDVLERLKLNGVKMRPLTNDTSLNVEVYHISKFNTSESPYEGHYPHNNTTVESSKETVDLRAGDFIISADQFACRYLIETLEPEAPDSFFNWNFFDTILQQKEHFSPYVFEEVALELLDSNDELKKEFQLKKADDKDFAQNWYAQLDFIYKHSPYHEKAYMRYPIYRLVD